MTTKRLVDPNSDASELERRLLAAATDPKPREGDRKAVWQRLMLGLTELPDAALGGADGGAPLPVEPDLGAAPAPLPAPAPSLVPALPWAPVLLSGVLGLAVGVVATTSFFLLRDDASPPASPAPASTASSSPSVATVEPRTASTPDQDAVEPPARAESPPSVPVEKLSPATRPNAPRPESETAAPAPSVDVASQLRQEAGLLRRAREQLGRGALTEASKALAASRAQFPDSRLSQERDALTIELFVRQGRTHEATSLARAFLSKHPHSPHAAQVRRALEPPTQD